MQSMNTAFSIPHQNSSRLLLTPANTRIHEILGNSRVQLNNASKLAIGENLRIAEILDAVRCHFDEDNMPTMVRLHLTKDEVLLV